MSTVSLCQVSFFLSMQPSLGCLFHHLVLFLSMQNQGQKLLDEREGGGDGGLCFRRCSA